MLVAVEEGVGEADVEIVPQELRTLIASMAIKDSEVAHRNLLVNTEVLNHLIRIFHVIPLTLVSNNTCIETLSLEL